MSEDSSVTVNFSKAMPLFPLEGVALLPQQVIPLHIFEPRYRQMIDQVLDGMGQIALATFDGVEWKNTYLSRPPIKRAVCVSQIVQHERLADGRFNLLLQGICRATIEQETEPEESQLYRAAMLSPNGVEVSDTPHLFPLREWIGEQLQDGPLSKHTLADKVLEYVENDAVSTPAVLELVAFAMIQDHKVRYKLLADGSVESRAETLRSGLEHLAWLISAAESQGSDEWPKGLSWN